MRGQDLGGCGHRREKEINRKKTSYSRDPKSTKNLDENYHKMKPWVMTPTRMSSRDH